MPNEDENIINSLSLAALYDGRAILTMPLELLSVLKTFSNAQLIESDHLMKSMSKELINTGKKYYSRVFLLLWLAKKKNQCLLTLNLIIFIFCILI